MRRGSVLRTNWLRVSMLGGLLACLGCLGGPGGETVEPTAQVEALTLSRRLCGGPTGLTCGPREFCNGKAGLCPGPQQLGVCQARPDVCAQIWRPVCGCDGKTYANACMAHAAGSAVAHEGVCFRACKSNESCAETDYCDKPTGQCGDVGVCRPRPQICTKIYRPVCGCDGKTYGNACAGAAGGVTAASLGECPPKVFCGGIAGFPCPGAGVCVDDPSDECDPEAGGADCGGMCLCKVNQLCVAGSHFDPSPEVCACVPDAPRPCGTVLCPVGQTCCNASCGICTPPGQLCIQIACE